MIRVSRSFLFLVAAALASLSACNGSSEENAAAAGSGGSATSSTGASSSTSTSMGSGGTASGGSPASTGSAGSTSSSSASGGALTDGGLDPSFGTDGVVTTALGAGMDYPVYLGEDANGSILVAGGDELNNATWVARLTSAGTLDTSYGTGGLVLVPGVRPGGPTDQVGDIALQSDGKVVIVNPDGQGNVVVRLDTTGAPDASFGTSGRATLSAFMPFSGALAPDGSIVLLGQSPTAVLTIGRLTPSGAIDGTFGSGGVVAASYLSQPGGVAVDAQGRIVVLCPSAATGVQLARFTTSGALDTTFGGTGIVDTMLDALVGGEPPSLSARTLALQPDGSILVGASEPDGPALTRYTPAGALDTSFGVNGVVAFPATDPIQTVSVASNGSILVAIGGLEASSPEVFRLTSTGAFDTTFGKGGSVSSAAAIMAALPLANGDSVYATFFSKTTIERVTATGAADATFGSAGGATFAWDSSADQVFALAQAPNGDVIAAGALLNTFPGWGLARYSANGVVDKAFLAKSSATSNGYGYPTGLAVDAAGRSIVIAQSGCPVTRFTSAGASDPSFGANGDTTLQPPMGESQCYAVALDASGRILASGGNTITSSSSFLLARLTSAGKLDTTFGTSGEVAAPAVTTPVSNGAAAFAMALQSDGKIVAAGYVADAANGTSFAVARYTEAGALDTTFNGTGWTTFPVPTGTDTAPKQVARAIAIQADGKIVVAGNAGQSDEPTPAAGDFWSYLGYTSHLVVARLTTDGALDTSFGQGGILYAEVGLPIAIGEAVVIESDGTLAVGGTAWDGAEEHGILARVSPQGTVSASDVTSLGVGAASAIHALLVEQPAGKIIAGGSAFLSPTGLDFALVRFN